MSDPAIEYPDTMPPLPAPLADTVARWRAAMVNAQPDIAEATLRLAAIQLWRTTAVAVTVHPSDAANIRLAIADELYEMAIIGRIEADNAQSIIVEAQNPSLLDDNDDEPPPHTEIPPGGGGELDDVVPPTKVTPLKLTYFDDCGAFVQKRSILKGIIARGETLALIGPPGSGKSALITEIVVHAAAQIDWRGHRAKEACGWVVFALERGDLFKRRLRVYQQRDGLHGLPIAVADVVIDLLNPTCVKTIVSTVQEAERQFGCGVGGIVIDTYAKGIAANGGDEDKARDQNRAAANLRTVQSQIDVHIALVGHTGKDETRGARGSNAHLGDVDVMIQISGDTIKLAQVIKGNDQPERVIAEFKLEAFELGRDEDGDPITTAIVSTEHFEPTGRPSAKKPNLPPLPKAALKALFECIADDETTPRPDDIHVPVGVTCVTLANWRDRLLKLSIINADGNHREQFKRIHVTLKARGFIGIWDEFVWPVT